MEFNRDNSRPGSDEGGNEGGGRRSRKKMRRRKGGRGEALVLINIRIGVMLLFRLVYEPGELNSLMQRSDSLIPEIFNVTSPQRQK